MVVDGTSSLYHGHLMEAWQGCASALMYPGIANPGCSYKMLSAGIEPKHKNECDLECSPVALLCTDEDNVLRAQRGAYTKSRAKWR